MPPEYPTGGTCFGTHPLRSDSAAMTPAATAARAASGSVMIFAPSRA
jgi:hypothetical protein